jgi:hypothetical protein
MAARDMRVREVGPRRVQMVQLARENRDGRVHLELLDSDRGDGFDVPARPVTRGDCANVPRPCPFVSCRHHLYLDVASSGSLILNFPDLEPADLEHSCSLDVADDGRKRDVTVAERMNVTRERTRQIEKNGIRKMKLHRRLLGEFVEGGDVIAPAVPDVATVLKKRRRTSAAQHADLVLHEVRSIPRRTARELADAAELDLRTTRMALGWLRSSGHVDFERYSKQRCLWFPTAKEQSE